MALSAAPASAGWLVAGGPRWATFATRPEKAEPTPNYFGYGAGLSLGYSFKQVMDFGAFGYYVPGQLGQAEVFKESAVFYAYGGELAFRIAETVYLGFRGGTAEYQLYGRELDEELGGEWVGPAGGFSIGALHKLKTMHYLQTSFDVMHAVVENTDTEELGKRRIDSFSVSLTYVYNGKGSSRIENSVFGQFMNSFIFF